MESPPTKFKALLETIIYQKLVKNALSIIILVLFIKFYKVIKLFFNIYDSKKLLNLSKKKSINLDHMSKS